MDTPTLLNTLSIAGEYQCSVEATVRGLLYHINQSILEAAAGEQLTCIRERGNRSEDTFAVAVVEALSKRSGYSPNELCMDTGSCSLPKGPFRSGDRCFWTTLS